MNPSDGSMHSLPCGSKESLPVRAGIFKKIREMMDIVLILLWTVWMITLTAQYAWMIMAVKIH